MKVELKAVLSDSHLNAKQPSCQRQLEISINVNAEAIQENHLPLNLCLVIDYSGSMRGKPLEKVKQAAIDIISKLNPGDRISVVGFNHQAKVIIPCQGLETLSVVEQAIADLKANGGTAIDEGLKLGIQEIANGKNNRISQLFLLTDGENEHGDNQRCLKLAELASGYNITINTLGFGSHWNPDVLEKIADRAAGTLCHIEEPEQALREFQRLFTRVQSVNFTNAYLLLELHPQVRLAEMKPLAQVSPETIELTIEEIAGLYTTRLGDLMRDVPRVLLANLYLHSLSVGEITVAQVQIRYDDPISASEGLLSEQIPVTAIVQDTYQAAPSASVEKSVLALAKYRQTQLAEKKLQDGDRRGAATLLQTAAKTAIQLGDKGGATVLQNSATRLQAGEELSDAERKKTRMAAKTQLQ
ncbi:MAG: VWA domain-containing protein [Gloeocapsa sp. DLM2.Bin57]|jgi:Ca-activated chloride channel family protein|nr:MAG: VWA domain-containing protein [Gloeocapsa sp. DLM2.Bin57]